MHVLTAHEDVLEGDLWVHARTDLADFYAGRLTLRQVWVRFSGLPAEANIWATLEAETAKQASRQKVRDIDDVLRMVGG